MTFLFRCRECGAPASATSREPAPSCLNDGSEMRRDYRAEGVGLGTGVKVSRSGTDADSAALFLPSNKDYAGPSDPDGQKGMRAWRERHGPRDTNKRPFWPGDVDKKFHAIGKPKETRAE